MPVGIAKEQLEDAVGSCLTRKMLNAQFVEALLPLVQIVHAQSEMIASIVGVHSFSAVANKMKFLGRTESEPGTAETERRARDRLQTQDVMIEPTTVLHIADVEGDMVELVDFHKAQCSRFSIQASFFRTRLIFRNPG